jgi:hypothetical protein
VAHVCWTPTCASRPRTSCSIGYCRKQRGPPYGRTKLSRPVVVRPGTLRADILVGRRHLFSLAPGHRTSSLLAALLRFLQRAQFLLDQRCDSCLRFLAGRCAAAHGLRATCIRRAESSGGLPATSFGGLQHFHGPHILYGRPSSQFCVNFLSVFVLFMFDVLAHILIFGSVQHLYASYIYVLCLPASPTLFFMRFSCVFLFALFMCTPNYLFGGLLVVATSFHPPGPSVSH